MELHARPELAAQQRMVDDASGDVKVWCKNAKMQKRYYYYCIHIIYSLLMSVFGSGVAY